MTDQRQEVIDWFNGTQDYNQGVSLLERVSKKARILGNMMLRGESKSTREKLIWELNKIAQLKRIPVPAKQNILKTQSERNKSAPQYESIPQEVNFNLIKGEDIETYPPVVKRLVHEYSDLYMLRGKNHRFMTKVGTENDAESIDARQVFITEIARLSARLEILNGFFENFKKDGIVPDESILWPGNEALKDENEDLSLGDITRFTAEELKAMKKNIQTNKVKDQNLLLYGTKTIAADKKERPIPDGPKRIKLERRIARREQQIYDINMQLAKIS